jgi:hypothetical protein
VHHDIATHSGLISLRLEFSTLQDGWTMGGGGAHIQPTIRRELPGKDLWRSLEAMLVMVAMIERSSRTGNYSRGRRRSHLLWWRCRLISLREKGPVNLVTRVRQWLFFSVQGADLVAKGYGPRGGLVNRAVTNAPL